ncbi:MAG: cyclic 2,3-diphosphoglycerate synthase [Candidatus Aenigmatarchaeota archaeon]
MRTKVIIMGAAGRDFHNFNTFFRENGDYEVVCFTATQIPGIDTRMYPKELSGNLYPRGIQIYPESRLVELIRKYNAEQVILSYSDLSYQYVMNKASEILAAGADFRLLRPEVTMIKSKKPVISVTAVRTGSGKSQTTRKLCMTLKEKGKKVVVVRHPMPYGDLKKQISQRFASYEDLDKYECTIEEREEYEPLIREGIIVYAGVDYGEILKNAEKEADIIVWDGGNNDTPFYKPDVSIVIADPHRAGHEISYYPGEVNVRMADYVIINKENTAHEENIKQVENNVKIVNPTAKIIHADSVVTVDDPNLIHGKSVLVVEDGPTLTHGGMAYGAGAVAAAMYSAIMVDPKPDAIGSLKAVYKKFPHLDKILPAMGYGKKQIKELELMINKINCDAVVIGTPIDLTKVLSVNKPIVRVKYDLSEKGKPNIEVIVKDFLRKYK